MAAPAADNHANGQPIHAMVFNSKGKFFLNLDDSGAAQPVTVAPVAKPAPKAEAKPKAAAPVSIQAPSASGAASTAAPTSTPTPDTAAAPQGQVLTTAEAIAAELAAAQAARPVAVDATFAPECLTPGSALPMRRRRGGANLAGFRAMGGSLFGKK